MDWKDIALLLVGAVQVLAALVLRGVSARIDDAKRIADAALPREEFRAIRADALREREELRADVNELYNRQDEAKDSMRQALDNLRDDMHDRLERMRSDMNGGFQRIEATMRDMK